MSLFFEEVRLLLDESNESSKLLTCLFKSEVLSSFSSWARRTFNQLEISSSPITGFLTSYESVALGEHFSGPPVNEIKLR